MLCCASSCLDIKSRGLLCQDFQMFVCLALDSRFYILQGLKCNLLL